MSINLFITENDITQMWVNKHTTAGVVLEDGSEITIELEVLIKLIKLYENEMKEL